MVPLRPATQPPGVTGQPPAARTSMDAVRAFGPVHGFVNLTTLSPAARRAVVDAGLRLNRLLDARLLEEA
jgi:hypothetical protein